MLSEHRLIVLSLALFLQAGCKSTDGTVESDGGPSNITTVCDVAIVGGGVGGLHTAMRLGAQSGSKVCLFEKEERLGGRIYDIGKPPNTAAAPFLGNGGRRVMDGQTVVFGLAKELGIQLDEPKTGSDLVFARGKFATNKDDFLPLYPGLTYDHTKPDVESQLLKQLLSSPERAHADKYHDFKSYIHQVIGPVGYQYLHDMNRFRGDFEYPLSARGYLGFLAEEIDVCCQTFYPVGGMSAFVRAMAAKVQASGVRVFTSEPVTAIDGTSGVYQLRTAKRVVAADKVIIAVPPAAFDHIGGSIAKRIQQRPEYQALVGVRVTVINQWFKDSWWDKVRTADGKNIWRAYTTGHCISYVEIPPEAYAAPMHAIRTVYNDSAACADFWAKLAKGPIEQMEAELHKGLEHLFADNHITTPVQIPPAVATTFWEWPDGWYWIKAGSPLTNADIFQWATEPLAGEDIGLVSEAYNPQRSAWTDAAYKSSIHLLNTKYAMKLSGQ